MSRLLPVLLITLLGSGCAPREQAFDCTLVSASSSSDELNMTPTRARFQSISYAFKSEVGALRTYVQKETGRTLEFNPASGLLRINEQDWSCKKYSLDVERKLRD
jgi:hypothetical protein